MKHQILETKIDDITIEYIFAEPDGGAPQNGETILCIHGFPDNLHSFDKQLGFFTDNGYRLIVPSIPGYTPESIPADGVCTVGRFIAYIQKFIETLDLNFHLIAHDWGAIFSAVLTATMADRMSSQVVMGLPAYYKLLGEIMWSPGQEAAVKYWYKTFLTKGDWAHEAVKLNDLEFIEMLWKDWSPNWKYTPEEIESVKASFRKDGVVEAAVAYYRTIGGPKDEDKIVLEAENYPVTIPTLLIGGKEDGCTVISNYEKTYVEMYPGGIEMKMVDAGHFPHREKPELVNKWMLDFIKKHKA